MDVIIDFFILDCVAFEIFISRDMKSKMISYNHLKYLKCN